MVAVTGIVFDFEGDSEGDSESDSEGDSEGDCEAVGDLGIVGTGGGVGL